LGRLAGFTNQKPARRTLTGHAPWVKVVDTLAGLAPRAEALLQSARALASPPLPASSACSSWQAAAGVTASLATEIYQGLIGNPDDYLRRTIARAALPSPRGPVCANHARASSRPDAASTCSNSTGGR
jgi:hypothetical protein